ncbi:MAG: aminotransferase class V-fold PLP-dependent enzyme [Flavobacteriaceae bacterium]
MQYRKSFPGLQKCIYADTAATGLMHTDLAKWRQQHDHNQLSSGSSNWSEIVSILNETRVTLKRFFKADQSEVALVPNFSIGINLLLENQLPDQNVLLIKHDYPSVNWPIENRKFNATYVAPDPDLERNISRIVGSGNIHILALSLVQWLNGIRIRPGFLKELKDQHPSLLIIADGTQYCGAFSLDFDSSGIDVLGASGYKWLLGGYGNGFMIIRKSAISRFSTPSAGFNSADGDLRRRHSYPFWKRLEPGHLDGMNFGSLNYSLKMLNELGMDKIDSHNRSLAEYAQRAFGKLGLLQKEVLERQVHGSIFRLEADRDLFEHLKHNGVMCSWRSDGVRLSFHFYNTEQEIDRIVEIIKTKH